MDFITIKGYKSIRELRFPVQSINILIGANGAGKSNFISFFKFIHTLYEQNLAAFVATHGGVNKFLYQGRKVTEKIEGKLSFDNHTNAYEFELTAGEDSFIVTARIS